MAKLGRYSADRKKTATITTATKTVTVAECGTIFGLNLADGIAVTLPTVAAAGEGWWCKFVIQTLFTSDATITSSDGAGSIIGHFAVATPDAAGNSITHNGEVISIEADNDVLGDQLELVVVNSKWVLNGVTST